MFLCNQGIRELAKPPTLSEILHSNQIQRQQKKEEEEEESKGKKRKHESDVEQNEEDSSNEEEKRPKERKIMKRAKNVKSQSFSVSVFSLFLYKDSIFFFLADCDINGGESQFACERA